MTMPEMWGQSRSLTGLAPGRRHKPRPTSQRLAVSTRSGPQGDGLIWPHLATNFSAAV